MHVTMHRGRRPASCQRSIGHIKLNGKLGDGNLYIDTLRKIVSKLEVKQLYMDVLLKTEEINFYLKGFGDSNAKLSYEAPNVSTPNPGNGKLGFKMK